MKPAAHHYLKEYLEGRVQKKQLSSQCAEGIAVDQHFVYFLARFHFFTASLAVVRNYINLIVIPGGNELHRRLPRQEIDSDIAFADFFRYHPERLLYPSPWK